MDGSCGELGWFSKETSVGEVKRCTSEVMSMPSETLAIVSASSKSSLEDDSTPLADVWHRFPPDANLNVVVQFPARFEEILKCFDDIRPHEDAFKELVKLACEFGGDYMNQTNANLLKRAVTVVGDSLRGPGHALRRGWAIDALSKLLEHLLRTPKETCSETVQESIKMIAEELTALSKPDSFWYERQDASKTLNQLYASELVKSMPQLQGLLRGPDAYSTSRVGGA
jgi:hypothetical protein